MVLDEWPREIEKSIPLTRSDFFFTFPPFWAPQKYENFQKKKIFSKKWGPQKYENFQKKEDIFKNMKILKKKKIFIFLKIYSFF